MAIDNEFPVYDGISPSWADLSVKAALIGGGSLPLIDMKDVQAINTGRTLEVGEQRMKGGRLKKTTTGSASHEASITLYREAFDLWIENLSKAAQANGLVRGNEVLISLVHFNIIYQLTPPGSTKVFERRIKGARYGGDTMNTAEGTDADVVECPLVGIKTIADVIGGKEIVLL